MEKKNKKDASGKREIEACLKSKGSIFDSPVERYRGVQVSLDIYRGNVSRNDSIVLPVVGTRQSHVDSSGTEHISHVNTPRTVDTFI